MQRHRDRLTPWQVCILGGLAVIVGLVVAAPIAPQLTGVRQAAAPRGGQRSRAMTAAPAAAAVPAGMANGGGAAAGAAVRTAAGPASTTVPGAANCPMFPADNVWNTNVSRLPVDAHSAAWLRSMDAARTDLHPDFGPNAGGYPYGMPFTVVTSSSPLVRLRFQYASQSNAGPYPFGPATPIEGGPNASGDRHAIMVNKDTCTLYELWDARYAASASTAGSGAIWSLRSNALRPYGWTSADAAGLPILPGLLSFAQVRAAVADGRPITHAIRFTAAVTRSAFIWPARHQAGSGGSLNLPPMGARFRLKASFSVARFCSNATPYCKDAKVVLVEMQNYGLIVADNGSNWFFQGSAYPQWPDALVSLLKGIPAREFQAVDEACLMVHPYSGLASAKPGCPIG